MKHPGPWVLEGKMVNPPIWDGIIAYGGVTPVAWVDNRRSLCFADDEAKRLILAAPELLEALVRILEEVDAVSGDEAMEHASALIARVEGKP